MYIRKPVAISAESYDLKNRICDALYMALKNKSKHVHKNWEKVLEKVEEIKNNIGESYHDKTITYIDKDLSAPINVKVRDPHYELIWEVVAENPRPNKKYVMYFLSAVGKAKAAIFISSALKTDENTIKNYLREISDCITLANGEYCCYALENKGLYVKKYFAVPEKEKWDLKVICCNNYIIIESFDGQKIILNETDDFVFNQMN